MLRPKRPPAPPPPSTLLADLHRSAIGAAIMTSLFIIWVALYQTQWTHWGSVGTDIMVVGRKQDTAWWT